MNKLILATAWLAAVGASGFAVAQTTADVPHSTVSQQGTTVDTHVTTANKQVPAVDSRDCIRETGSHIRNPNQKCLPVNGKSYSREDLQRTGDPNMGRALQKLDPSVQGGGR